MRTNVTAKGRKKMKTAFPIVVAGVLLVTASKGLAQPIIVTQPSDQFLSTNGTANFSVGTSGTALSYQWFFDGAALGGSNSPSLSLVNPSPAQWGYYSVVVSNNTGSVTSRLAELKVFMPALHQLSGIEPQAGGSMNLNFAGEVSSSFGRYYDLYPVDASSDLVQWTPLAMVQRANASLDTLRFVDTNAPQFRQRFFRTPTNQLATPDPAPTGPYAIGTFSMLFTNTSRSNATFMTTFWYPAMAQAGVLPAKFVDPQIANSVYFNWTNSGGPNDSSVAAAFYSHSLSNAPIAANQAAYPVVLYDPGSRCQRREQTGKLEDLASWGFVVVALDTSDTYLSVYPDGTLVYGQHNYSTLQGIMSDINGRVLDLQFVLDQLGVLNANDPRLGGRLDLNHIGAIGFSLGSSVTAELALRDPRCQATVAVEGPWWDTNILAQPLGVPYLQLISGAGPDPDPFEDYDCADERLLVHDQQLTNAYWVKLTSTVENSFEDVALVVSPTEFVTVFGTSMSGQYVPPTRVTQIYRTYVLSFFNKYLKGEDNHLLDDPPPGYPEIMQSLSASTVSNSPAYPKGGLVQGNDGNLYGTTAYGGSGNNGTVFRVTTNGLSTTLVWFNGTNGSHPMAGLVQGSDGNFYGTTDCGGANENNGTVFQMTPTGVLTTLVSLNGSNGSHPYAGLVQGSDGNFYGTTAWGGTYGFGTVFQMTPGGALTTLVSFNGADGCAPLAPLVQGTDGNFYGTVSGDSGNGFGSVFQVTPAGVLTTKVVFVSANQNPSGGLLQASSGLLYGTTECGGILNLNAGSGLGTVFKMTSAGALRTVASFGGTNGSHCISGLVQGSDGNFYGTTAGGGMGGCPTGGGGTVFRMTPPGALTTLVSFNGADGSSPQSALIQGTDGNFYGTTTYGGPCGGGTVFQVTTNGVLTTLVAFGSPTNSP